MTKHPTETLTFGDLPAPATGAAKYSISSRLTGGYDVIVVSSDATRRTVEYKPTFKSALRTAIRLQKRENASAAKAGPGATRWS